MQLISHAKKRWVSTFFLFFGAQDSVTGICLLPHTPWIPSILPLSENVLLQWNSRASLTLEPGLVPRLQRRAGMSWDVSLGEVALIPVTFFTLGCQKQVWTLQLKILCEIGALKSWEIRCNNHCGGVVHFFSRPSIMWWADFRSWWTVSASRYPAGVLPPLQMRGISIQMILFSSSPSLSKCFLVWFLHLLCSDCRKWKAAVWNGDLQHWQIHTGSPDVCYLVCKGKEMSP